MFQETILQINNGATVAELSKALTDVVAAVRSTGKSGAVSLKLSVRPASKGNVDVLIVESQVNSKLPEPDRGVTIFYATDTNLLVRSDPRQQKLPLRVVELDQSPRELKEVNS